MFVLTQFFDSHTGKRRIVGIIGIWIKFEQIADLYLDWSLIICHVKCSSSQYNLRVPILYYFFVPFLDKLTQLTQF